MKIRHVIMWFVLFYGTAIALDAILHLGFDWMETIVCSIVCSLISVGLASGWTPSTPDDAPPWLRGRKY